MKRLWRWLTRRWRSGVETPASEERPSGTRDGDLPPALRADPSPETLRVSWGRGTATATADGSSPLPLSLARDEAAGSGEGDDDGNDPLAERLGELEARLKEIEEAMGVQDGMHGEDLDRTGDEVWEGEGTVPRALMEAERVLAKAREQCGASLEGDDGVDVTDETSRAVRRGVPQGIPGQQARRNAARFWEGVL